MTSGRGRREKADLLFLPRKEEMILLLEDQYKERDVTVSKALLLIPKEET